MSKGLDLIITGIGGQGTVSVGHLISDTLTELDIPFVAAETHGMSQRGGSVIFHLRIGKDKLAPIIAKQSADAILAGEPMEALRAMEYLKPNGIILSEKHGILSPVAQQMGFEYPDFNEILERIGEYTSNLHLIEALRLADEVGNDKSANIVILGALLSFNLLPISYEVIADKIARKWPKFKEMNLSALKAGFEFRQEEPVVI